MTDENKRAEEVMEEVVEKADKDITEEAKKEENTGYKTAGTAEENSGKENSRKPADSEEAEDVSEEVENVSEETEDESEEIEDGCEETETSFEEASNESEAEESEEAEKTAEGKKEKKLRWKKKDKKDEKIEELTDRLKRSMAEFDNYRKRTDKEKASMYIIGAKEVVEKMLPVIDNFERGLASATPEQKADPFVEGFDKIYKQLCKTLEDMGVKPIEAVGKEFDPNFHNAVMHVDDENVGENIVVEEFQKGYLYKDFVVRHSMVKVAN